MKPLFHSPFALVLVGGCAAGTVPPAPVPPADAPPSGATPPGPPASATSIQASRCEGSSLTFDEIWIDACRTAGEPETTDEPPGIVLELAASPTYVSGQKTKLGVAYVNRSDRDAVILFRHRCLELQPSQMFSLVVETSRGDRAAVEQDRPPAMPFSNAPCELPYVRATLPPGGKVSTFVAFEVSSETPIGPAPQGPLAPGTYSVEVSGPLARKTPLAAKFPLVVTQR